jgi:hypothetical protein
VTTHLVIGIGDVCAGQVQTGQSNQGSAVIEKEACRNHQLAETVSVIRYGHCMSIQ